MPLLFFYKDGFGIKYPMNFKEHSLSGYLVEGRIFWYLSQISAKWNNMKKALFRNWTREAENNYYVTRATKLNLVNAKIKLLGFYILLHTLNTMMMIMMTTIIIIIIIPLILSSSILIGHCSWLVLLTASSVCAELMNVSFFYGRPTLVCPCVGVHRRKLHMGSFLLHQHCSACFVRLTWMVYEMRIKSSYSCCFFGCWFVKNISQQPCVVQVVQRYSRKDTA